MDSSKGMLGFHESHAKIGAIVISIAVAACGCSSMGNRNGGASGNSAAGNGVGASGTTASAGGHAATGATGGTNAGIAGQTAIGGSGKGGATTTGTGGVSSGAMAGAPGGAGASGTSAAGQPATGGAGAAGGGAGSGPSATDPIIPDINGDCPMFMAGTSIATVMGISATVIAGDKKDGTGALVFYWYGTGGLGDVSFLPQAVKDEITGDGGIVFAQNMALNTGGDCSGTGTFGIDDMKISDQVAACAVKNYGINPRRIYATGCSAGGLMTGCMGIMRSNYIAAVAPNSGGITIGYGPLQNPKHAPAAITMNGGAGDNVIVNFGNTSEAYDNYILKYGGFAVNCIHNLGHCGAPADLYASAWQFMKDHPFGVSPEPYAGGVPSTFPPYCQIAQMTSMAPLGGF